MTKFKVGDMVTTSYNPKRFEGSIFYIEEVDIDYGYPYKMVLTTKGKGSENVGYSSRWKDDGDMVLYQDNYKNMSIIEKFKISLIGEPNKSFRKAGITNGDNMLTLEGQQIFLSYLLEKNGDAFKKDVVDRLLAEDKE